MRGKLGGCQYHPAPDRNIPAYAGKTGFERSVDRVSPEHPRVCGENLVGFPLNRTPPRNIPAYAGKTSCLGRAGFLLGEHPRVCGENCPSLALPGPTTGTSPRMRGKQCAKHQKCWFSRNIPAYAGKTTSAANPAFQDQEHPRVCGENTDCVCGHIGV